MKRARRKQLKPATCLMMLTISSPKGTSLAGMLQQKTRISTLHHYTDTLNSHLRLVVVFLSSNVILAV